MATPPAKAAEDPRREGQRQQRQRADVEPAPADPFVQHICPKPGAVGHDVVEQGVGQRLRGRLVGVGWRVAGGVAQAVGQRHEGGRRQRHCQHSHRYGATEDRPALSTLAPPQRRPGQHNQADAQIERVVAAAGGDHHRHRQRRQHHRQPVALA